ncbi:hypothetical protein [Acinetobacter pittii]|uniref:hypothetical protein n=1 Tax=Acinetobacter pittii TaxID=48296 RepID=UPI00301C5595
MKGSINSIAQQVLDGRRRMARQMVLTTTSSIPALVYGKKVIDTDQGKRLDDSWGGLGVMGEDDEQAVDYEEKGYAMVLLDSFTGAALNRGLIAVDGAEPSFLAYVEPFDNDLDLFKQYVNPVDWTLKSGDIMCLLLSEEFALWVENVGAQGQTLVGDFGVKYLLNKRDDLAYIGLFDKRPDVP